MSAPTSNPVPQMPPLRPAAGGPETPATVATLPGDGWRVRTAEGRDVSVVGFVVRVDGRTFPIIPTATGGIAVVGLRDNFLYHPEDLDRPPAA